tara:strand:- start:1596 stop:2858 length:1263 start_codon:yes stop_codon:yes gene_type:complete
VTKVYLKGPILTQSGYGHHTRTVYRALKSKEGLFDVYVQPISWGATSWQWKDDEERREIDAILTKTVEYIKGGGKFDMSVQVTIPNEWENLAPVNIGVTAGIETDKVAANWIEKGNMMDKILTISQHSLDSYKDTVYNAKDSQTGEEFEYRLKTPIDFVSYPVSEFEPAAAELNFETNFNFLTVAQMGPRKNLTATINNFVETFRDNEDVGLIIKTNMSKNSLIDRLNCMTLLQQQIHNLGEKKCKVYLLHGSLTDEEMSALYNHEKVKVVVSTSHGEGFGLPLFEAAYYGVPVVATDWSGHLDFLYKEVKQKNGKTRKKHMFGKVNYKLERIPKEAVWDGVLIEEARWAYPDHASLKKNLTEVHKDYGRFKKRSKELQKWVRQEFSQEKIYNQYIEHLEPYASHIDEEVEDLFNELSIE